MATVAAHGLDNARPRPPGEDPDPAWLTAGSVQTHRLVGLLGDFVRDPAFPLDAGATDAFADLENSWQRHVLSMERLLMRIADEFDRTGVPFRVFKGPALAHTVYQDPAQRTFGDLDILVPGTQLASARQVLVEELEGDDVFPELRSGFDAEFAKDVMVRVEGAEVDLHRTLAAGPFGLRIPVHELFDSPTPFVVGDREFLTLSPVPTLLQVCYNAALGDVPPRLLSLRDVAQVHDAFRPALDEVLETADRWGGTAVVARAVSLSWDTFALEPTEISEWADSYRPSRLDRALLSASISERRSYTRQVAALFAIKGIRARGRYVRGIVAPSPEYLKARGWTTRSHISRAIARLRPRP